MIVDFTSIKEKFHQGINIFLREEVKRRTPFLSMVGTRYIHEGNRTSCETVDHEEKNLDYKKVESGFSLTREEMSEMTFKEIVEKVQESAKDMAGQMEGGVFQTLNEMINKTGNIIPGNPPFSPEAFLKGLEMIRIDFDDTREKPNLPSLVMHPKLAQKAKEQEARMTNKEKRQFDKKQKEILDKKYKQYVARENKRKLVD